jgi:hypothetical protein
VDRISVEPEHVLEVGFALLGVGFVSGLVLLVGGRILGDAEQRRRHAEAAPEPGSVPAERHQQLSTSPR